MHARSFLLYEAGTSAACEAMALRQEKATDSFSLFFFFSSRSDFLFFFSTLVFFFSIVIKKKNEKSSVVTQSLAANRLSKKEFGF